MGNSRYEKDFSIFNKLTKFAKSTIIKDERLALEMETSESASNAAKFTSALENYYTPSDDEKVIYLNKAGKEGYSFKVSDNSYIYKELTSSERSSYTGIRFVKDKYDEVTLQTVLSDVARYNKIYIKTNMVYREVSITSVNNNDRLYVRRKGAGIYKAVGYAASLEYPTIYKLNDDKKYMQIITTNNQINIFDGDLLVYTKFAATINGKFVEIPMSNVKLPYNVYYYESYTGSGEYISITSLQDIMNISSSNIFLYDTGVYTNISRSEIELDPYVKYYYVVDYFDMDIDAAPYYETSNIYLEKNSNIITLASYISQDISDKYKNIFIHINDDEVLTYFRFENVRYDSSFNIVEQQPSGDGLTYLKKDEYCDSCYEHKYVKTVNTNNITTYVCPSCGNTKELDDMYLFKDIYMVTYMDDSIILKCEISHNQDMINTYKRKGTTIYKLEFVENIINPDRELNEYYINLAKFNVDIAIARLYGDNHILKYDDTILTNNEYDKFIVSYYNTLRYFNDVFDNKALHIYNNYRNVVIFFVMIATINRVIDLDYKNVRTVKEYTNRDARNLLYSYGIYELDNIPLAYQLDILENITSILKKRGSDSVISEILNIFTGSKVNVYKYLMVKDYVRDSNGDIVTPKIFTESDIYNIINDGISNGTNYISILEKILESRRSVFNMKYDNMDVSTIKKYIYLYYSAFIENFVYNENISDEDNLETINNIKNAYSEYFKSDVSSNNILIDLNSYILETIISYYKELSIKNTYNYYENDFRLLFLENSSILSGYNYFNDYKSKYNELYTNAIVTSYGDISDTSFKNILITEKENILENVIEDSELDESLFDYPYEKQTGFMIVVNLYGYVKSIKNLDINQMKIIYENNNMEYIEINDGLTSVKDLFINTMYDRIKNENFHKPIITDYLIWEKYLSDGMTMVQIYNDILDQQGL